MTESQKINACIAHMLNFSVFHLIRTSFALAAVTEPWAVKGLLPPNYLFAYKDSEIRSADLEMEILTYLEDKNIKKLLKNIYTLIDFKSSFENLNGIDFLEVVVDKETYQMAIAVYIEEDDDLLDYGGRVALLCDVNYFMYLNLWKCTELITHQSIIIDEAREILFNDELHTYAYGFAESEDSNVQMLYDLMADLTFDV